MPHYGKYRGTVADNRDPLQLGRLQLRVPDVFGAAPSNWALPCLPPGPRPAFPEIGDTVWVEFEQGDANHPVWCGVFWTEASNVPETLRQPAPTDTLSLRTPDGAMIDIGPAGIVISNGKGASIELSGPSVSINHGALAIT